MLLDCFTYIESNRNAIGKTPTYFWNFPHFQILKKVLSHTSVSHNRIGTCYGALSMVYCSGIYRYTIVQ